MSDGVPKPFDFQVTPPAARKPERPADDEPLNVPADPPAYRTETRDAPDSPAEAVDSDRESQALLGRQLARAMEEGGYYPIVLFGTTNSGKTSLLLSLFSALISEPRLETGISLCDPLLGSADGYGRQLHLDAKKLFELGTLAFIAGEPTPATTADLPFFIPVEVQPSEGRPAQRFAFLESKGEWYRQQRKPGQLYTEMQGFDAPEPQAATEAFINSYQGGITFLYVAPFTQAPAYVAKEPDKEDAQDNAAIHSASIAIRYVVEAYNRARTSYRSSDRHLLLVTKWDARSAHQHDPADVVREDRAALADFCHRHYGQSLAAFNKLRLDDEQFGINAYVSGKIGQHGLIQQRTDDDLQEVIKNYPPRLWNFLYRNALSAFGEAPAPLIPEPPEPPFIVRAWRRMLDFASGR